jgi:hypothetical protein
MHARVSDIRARNMMPNCCLNDLLKNLVENNFGIVFIE